MIDTFQTERLVAERLRDDHLGILTEMHKDPRVMATLGGVRSEEQSRLFHEESLGQWDRHGHGLWVLRDRTDGRFVGRGGIRHVTLGDVDEVEIAYALMSEYWGRGLATVALH
jgi:[ribosomal protein S5]-alanine N-acetyltransferase